MFICETCGYSTKIKCNLAKHLNRKTKCGPENVTFEPENVTFKSENVTFESENVTFNPENVTSKRYRMDKANPLMCVHCTSLFKHRSNKCRHQKTCKLNPENMPPPPPPVVVEHHTTINNNNNITNNNIDNSNNVTININNFGDENVDYLLSHGGVDDPRIRSALQHLRDTMLLVYFNQDHPENQTVRKLKKKDSTMDVLVNNRWQPECCSTGIPKLRDSLSIMLKSPKLTDLKAMTNKSCRELLYEYTKAGEVPESTVLEQYDTNTAEQIERVCYNECVFTLDEYVAELHNKRQLYGKACVTDIKNKLNVIRETYNLNIFTCKDIVQLLIDRKYMDPKINVPNKGVSGVSIY